MSACEGQRSDTFRHQLYQRDGCTKSENTLSPTGLSRLSVHRVDNNFAYHSASLRGDMHRYKNSHYRYLVAYCKYGSLSLNRN